MTDTELKPALSAAEWERVAYRYDAMMAINNDRLPNGDPRKITREDVEAVIDGALQATDEFPLDPDAMALEAKLRGVAAKLAALLPPE
jgi:hypothetical protein